MEMSVPKYHEFMKPMLGLLRDGKSHTMKELQKALAVEFHLSQDDISEMLPSGRQSIFLNRVGWAKTYLKKAGLVESPARATCIITKDGLKVLDEDPSAIDPKYLERFKSFQKFWNAASNNNTEHVEKSVGTDNEELTPDDQLEKAYTEINDALATEVLNEVMKVPPYVFEKMVMDLLLCMGYGSPDTGSYRTKASGDGGIDGVIMEDKLGFSLIYMQAKHWDINQTVGQPVIQSFVGAIAKKDGNGLFVTTAKFSENAKQYAKEQHIILIDGMRLAKLMIEHDFCVSVRKIFEIKAIDTDALAEYQQEE